VRITFEADAEDHRAIEEWFFDQDWAVACGLWVPLLSSKIDFRRDVRLTRASLNACTRSVRVLDVSKGDLGFLFRMRFEWVTGIRFISVT
jgi:hypothetical protein